MSVYVLAVKSSNLPGQPVAPVVQAKAKAKTRAAKAKAKGQATPPVAEQGPKTVDQLVGEISSLAAYKATVSDLCCWCLVQTKVKP